MEDYVVHFEKMPLPDRAADDMRAATKLIREYGLAKHVWHEREDQEPNKHCMAGAVFPDLNGETIDFILRFGPVGEYLTEVIKEQFLDRIPREHDHLGPYELSEVDYITRFNDHKDTTAEDVILVLEKAATLIDERG